MAEDESWTVLQVIAWIRHRDALEVERFAGPGLEGRYQAEKFFPRAGPMSWEKAEQIARETLCAGALVGRDREGALVTRAKWNSLAPGRAPPGTWFYADDVRTRWPARPVSVSELERWYIDLYVPGIPRSDAPPGLASDLEDAVKHFLPRQVIRQRLLRVRRQCAPAQWEIRKIGRKRNPPK